jgi:hypothetical protein
MSCTLSFVDSFFRAAGRALFFGLIALLAASCAVDQLPTELLAPELDAGPAPLDDPPEPKTSLGTIWSLADSASYETQVWEQIDISADTTLTLTSTTWASPNHSFALFIPAQTGVSLGTLDDITVRIPTYASLNTSCHHVTFEFHRARANKTFNPSAEFTASFPEKYTLLPGSGSHDYIAFCVTETAGTPATHAYSNLQEVASSPADPRAEITFELAHFSRWVLEERIP